MTRWGMVVDLQKCIGCRACVAVCAQTNDVPPKRWRQVLDCGVSEYPDRQRLFLPMSCMHCSEPPCLEVCPTTATYRRPDGIVDVNYDLCVGCSYCIVACPYLARTITFQIGSVEMEAEWQEGGRTGPNLDRIGVCTKCNFCLPRVDAGLAQGLQPGLDPEASPACVSSCTAHALHFGDLDDPGSVASRLIQKNKMAYLQEELGTGPSVSYIMPSYPPASTRSSKNGKIELRGLRRQQVWGWSAVANFILGRMATGLYLLGFLIVSLQGDMTGVFQPAVFKLLAPMLAGLGFLALVFEAGRPLRALYLFRHLGRSWMSRETLAGAIFVSAAVLDWLFPHPALWGLAVAAAIGLTISQSFIIYRARAVTAWNVPLMPLLFLTSGFAMGSGLALLLAALGGLALERNLVVIGLSCAVLNLVVWLLYLRWSRNADFRKATAVLRRPNVLILIVGLGHLLPIRLLLPLLVAPGVGAGVWRIAAGLAGLALAAGGMRQTVGIIIGARYLRRNVLGRSK